MAQFHENLKSKIDDYIHLVYRVTKSFPKDELYGATSQIRRSALSVMLNYVEGYARGRDKVQLNFLEIAYGSLQESKYLLDFSLTEKYLNDADYKQAAKLADDIGAMLWGVLRGIKDNNQKAPNPKTHGSSSRIQDASFRTHDSNSKFQVASSKIQEKGQLALLSLLIIGAITLAAALSASFISRTEIGKGFRQSRIVTAQGAAESCMEEALMEAFPLFACTIQNYHSDNGGENINYRVAALLKKLTIHQTKSRPRHSNDNGLVETKNGSIIRKHMSYFHIPQPFASRINKFYGEHLIPYLNFHRPCAFPKIKILPNGKKKITYPPENYMTPYAKLKSLPNWQQYLQPGVTLEILETQANAKTPNQAARELQKAKQKLFNIVLPRYHDLRVIPPTKNA